MTGGVLPVIESMTGSTPPVDDEKHAACHRLSGTGSGAPLVFHFFLVTFPFVFSFSA